MAKPIPVHYDALNRPINIGDVIVTYHRGILLPAKVIRLGQVMVIVESLSGAGAGAELKKYPTECALVDEHAVLLYLLTKPNTVTKTK